MCKTRPWCKVIKFYDFMHTLSMSSEHIDPRHTLNYATLEYQGSYCYNMDTHIHINRAKGLKLLSLLKL